MEYSNSQDAGIDVYITGDLGLGGETVPIKIYESDEDDDDMHTRSIKTEELDLVCSKLAKREPTVYVTELPKEISQAQDLAIPNMEPEAQSDVFYTQETDSKGNTVVTIQVPLEGFVSSDGEENMQTIEIEVSENMLENDENEEHANRNIIKNEISNRGGEYIISGGEKYIIKQASSQKMRSRVPIWKRHTPKPPGCISNYLYPHGVRSMRSRVIIDCPTNIPVQEFKAQLADTSDIVTTLDVAPSTKRKVRELTTNSVSKLFAYPGKPFPCKKLYNLYQRHLTSKPQIHELPDDLELMPVGYLPSIDYSQVKRITRKRKTPDSIQNEVDILNEHDVLTMAAAESERGNMVQSMVPISDQVVRVLIKPGVAGEEQQEILVLHDGSEMLEGSASLQHSIEVLLAAAESGELGKEPQQVEQVFICNEGTYDENVADSFLTEQIIIVQNDIEEDELCGQIIGSS